VIQAATAFRVLLGGLKLDGPLALLLHDKRAGSDATPLNDIEYVESHEMATAHILG